MATLREAIDEAYASVDYSEIPLYAMEINHPAFSEPLRVIRWPLAGPEPAEFVCLHEPEAELDPGRPVKYVGFTFELTLPESSTNAEGSFKFRLSIFNDFDKYLFEAANGHGIIKATFRQYVKGREGEGPAIAWPGITISSPRREGADIVADGTILGWMKKPFGKLYLPTDYPALIAGR